MQGFPKFLLAKSKPLLWATVNSSVDTCGSNSETLLGIRNTCWWSHGLNSAGPPELAQSSSLEADGELDPQTAALWSSSVLRAVIFFRPSSVLKQSDEVFYSEPSMCMWLPCGSDGKESACQAGDAGLIPGSRWSPGEGSGNPLQYSCLGNPMDRGVWWAI